MNWLLRLSPISSSELAARERLGVFCVAVTSSLILSSLKSFPSRSSCNNECRIRRARSTHVPFSAHLWTICSADFLNVLPRLLFSYYCLAIAAARLDYPSCCPFAPSPPGLGYKFEATLVAFMAGPPLLIWSFFTPIPESPAVVPTGFAPF